MKPSAFEYVRPRDLAEAVRLLGEPDEDDCQVIAGGQSLVPMLNLRLARPSKLVDISDLGELQHLYVSEAEIMIGAAVTHARIEDGIGCDPTSTLLRRVAAGLAYRPVRNRGTVGGSLAQADPAGDWAPVLMGLGAIAHIASARGDRELAVSKLIEAPLTTAIEADEIIRQIRIPRLSDNALVGHRKFSNKPGAYAQSLASVVCDAERNWFSVVLATSTDVPSCLFKIARVLKAGTAVSANWSIIEKVVAEDLSNLSESVGWNTETRILHSTIVLRAIGDALACK